MLRVRVLLFIAIAFIQNSYASVLPINDNSVGFISAFKEGSYPNNPSRSTAFIAGDRKYILTCAHVIKDCSSFYFQPMKVTNLYKLNMYKLIPEMDIAILTIREDEIFPYKPIQLANYDKNIEIGDAINIVGWDRKNSYFNVESCDVKNTLQIGTIILKEKGVFELQKGDRYKMIVFDGPAVPGYSGSPILNQEGKAIGITVGMSENNVPNSTKHINYSILFDSCIREILSRE